MPKFQFSKEEREKIEQFAQRCECGCEIYEIKDFIRDLESLFDGKYLVDRKFLFSVYQHDTQFYDPEVYEDCPPFDRLLKELEEEK